MARLIEVIAGKMIKLDDSDEQEPFVDKSGVTEV